jgi:hypothetical protein
VNAARPNHGRGVIDLKGKRGKTFDMKHDIRLHASRRRRAIDRLQALTAGAAVAGLAGTAGFGVLAAATWSGHPSATGATTGTGAANAGTSAESSKSQNRQQGTTNDDGYPVFGFNPVPGSAGGSTTTQQPRVRNGSGGGHASTGGSN